MKESKSGHPLLLIGPMTQLDQAWKALLSQTLRQGFLKRRPPFVIGVDRGAWLFKRLTGNPPDLAVGDWDSLLGREKSLLKQVPHLTLSTDKNRSDLFFAAQHALKKKKSSSLTCIGFTEGRPDHHLAVLLDLHALATLPIQLLAPGTSYYFMGPNQKNLEFQSRSGAIVSVFSPGQKAKGITTQGLKYPLRNQDLPSSSFGLSNLVTQGLVQIRKSSGSLIVIELKSENY